MVLSGGKQAGPALLSHPPPAKNELMKPWSPPVYDGVLAMLAIIASYSGAEGVSTITPASGEAGRQQVCQTISQGWRRAGAAALTAAQSSTRCIMHAAIPTGVDAL